MPQSVLSDYILLSGFTEAFWNNDPSLLNQVCEALGIPTGNATTSLQNDAYYRLHDLQSPLIKLLQAMSVARLELMRSQLIATAQQVNGLCEILGALTRSLPGQALAARLERHVYEEIKEAFPKREPFIYKKEDWKSLQNEFERCQRALGLLGGHEIEFTTPDPQTNSKRLNENERFFQALGAMKSLMPPEWPNGNRPTYFRNAKALWPKSETPGKGRPSKTCLMLAVQECLPIVADAYQTVRRSREESTTEITPEEWNGHFASKRRTESFTNGWSISENLYEREGKLYRTITRTSPPPELESTDLDKISEIVLLLLDATTRCWKTWSIMGQSTTSRNIISAAFRKEPHCFPYAKIRAWADLYGQRWPRYVLDETEINRLCGLSLKDLRAWRKAGEASHPCLSCAYQACEYCTLKKDCDSYWKICSECHNRVIFYRKPENGPIWDLNFENKVVYRRYELEEWAVAHPDIPFTKLTYEAQEALRLTRMEETLEKRSVRARQRRKTRKMKLGS